MHELYEERRKELRKVTLHTVTFSGGDFHIDHILLMSSIRRHCQIKAGTLKDQKTKQEYTEQLNERLSKIMQETPDLFSPTDIDQHVTAICHRAKLVLSHESARGKPQITQEIIEKSNKKRTLRNKQDE
ncbi:hypothetical protein QYM36_020106 [Artemia franciscana]|uniref:Uncharacterized protein n=1 Tax=Artemia franciscana TaxID=6661 RepID=A0AA88KSM8_ARTSF|nr:hypothetical protein QYM36_020106 [Artemia franciscana]